MHHERRSRAASGSECEAIDDAEAPRDCELQLGRQVKECHASLESRLVCSRLVSDGEEARTSASTTYRSAVLDGRVWPPIASQTRLYRARVLVHSLHAQSSRASSAFFELRQGDIESTKLSIPKTFKKPPLSF